MSTEAHHPAESPIPGTEAGLRAEISQTRDELGETLEALASKLNVKKQAKRKAAQLGQKAGRLGKETAKFASERNAVVVSGGALLGLLAAIALIRRGRR
jgi:hypothetical protein